MEPLSLSAAAAATLVQLLGMFKQERADARDLTHREFMEWLEYHRHHQVMELISHTHHLATEVDALLRQDHEVIMAKLDDANIMLVDILAHIKGLSAITKTVSPGSGLSDDAVELIANFGQRGANRVMVVPDGSGRLQLEGVCTLGLDPRFFDDDLRSLVNHGLIVREELGDSRLQSYRITRAGARFASQLPPVPPLKPE